VLLATANIWGLPAPLSWPPRRLRFPRVRDWLETTGERALDVVALQEHWRFPGRPRALEGENWIRPAPEQGDSGLALQTHHRVLERAHGAFREGAARTLERLFIRKGWQRVALEVGGVRVDVVNTHLEAHAGAQHARIRAAQVDELLEAATCAEGAVVLAGDFNLYAASPEDCQTLQRIEAAGFADAVAPFDGSPTYERFGKRERFDRVFVRGLTPSGARVDRGARVADHRPVIVELK
jgi:endonuclease/exonuclease/phosphatase family metal-dependent hydrolase